VADGGSGGNGGDVYLEADRFVDSLSSLRKSHFFGFNGEKGWVKTYIITYYNYL